MDMEVKSVKKKFKTPAFAAGCSRKVIEDGAVLLGWELDLLIEKTILAMRSCEADVCAALDAIKAAGAVDTNEAVYAAGVAKND